MIFLSDSSQRLFLYLTIACIRSIRAFDESRDICVMCLNGFVDRESIQLLNEEGVKLVYEAPIDDNLIVQRNSTLPHELTKIRAWRHTEYERILLLDADCIAARDPRSIFDCPCFTARQGTFAPLNGARLLLLPDRKIYEDLIDIILFPQFSYELGYRKVGEFPHWQDEQRRSDWRFFSSESSQGLLFYYFGLLRREFGRHSGEVLTAFEHVGGLNKVETIKERYKDLYQYHGMLDSIIGRT